MRNDQKKYRRLGIQVGLRETDAAWHSPLMTFATVRVMKNMRIRSKGIRKPEKSKMGREKHWVQREP